MRGKVVLSGLDSEEREKFWLCPLCNFLTHRPGICDRCREEGLETVVHHAVQFPHRKIVM